MRGMNVKTLVLWAISRALYLAASAIGKHTGIPPVDRPRMYRTPWRAEPNDQARCAKYTLYVNHNGREREADLTRMIRCGRVVFGVEWSPDGPGTLYVLDARSEQ